jgi:hypothetical protein
VADKRPARQPPQSGDPEVIEYHFKFDIKVASHLDETRLRKLIDAEVARLKDALKAKR